jgi:hypothetical protein
MYAHVLFSCRPTEGFYDAALNEADDVRTTRDSTKADVRCQRAKVCRRPSVKTMLGGVCATLEYDTYGGRVGDKSVREVVHAVSEKFWRSLPVAFMVDVNGGVGFRYGPKCVQVG